MAGENGRNIGLSEIGHTFIVMTDWYPSQHIQRGDKHMTTTIGANGKEATYHGVPADDDYEYAHVLTIGNSIHVSGQLSQDMGAMIAPAALDEFGKPADLSMMAEQMRVTHANAAKILARIGANLGRVVGERLHVIDVDEAFAVAGKMHKMAGSSSGNADGNRHFSATGNRPHVRGQTDQGPSPKSSIYPMLIMILDGLASRLLFILLRPLLCSGHGGSPHLNVGRAVEAYAKARPQCASNLIGASRLAFPEQLIEIAFKAVLPPA